MKFKLRQEKGITMTALVITVITLLILTGIMINNTQSSLNINKLTNFYNDLELLRDKISTYYNEYGKLPAEIKYTNTTSISGVLSSKNDTGDFYVIDLEAMKGITLNYGKDYEKVKEDKENANYTDLYIINENSHNIFYVKGVEIKNDTSSEIYYTDYTEPDETTVDLRYIEGILIPNGYYYIGKINENIVISDIQDEEINTNKTNQYIWTEQASQITQIPTGITLNNSQKEYEFLKSVNTYKGYFKNSEGKVQYVVIDEEKWSEAYTKEAEYKDIKGDTVTIPEGFSVSMSPTMNIIDNGLVVKDKNDNEWVWVEVPKTVFVRATKSDDYDNIKADLITYATDYREGNENQGNNCHDEWYAIDGSTLVTASTTGLTETQKKLNNGCGLTYNEYQTTYKTMLSSIYTNCGFWISRYEIGDATSTASNTTRTSSSGTTGTAVSKPNQIPYNYITCSQAQKLSSKMAEGTNKTSSLLFGIQWDLTCKFLENNSDLTKKEIKSDSTSWGNYRNNSLTLVRGKYNIKPDSSTSVWTAFNVNTENYVMNFKTSSNENYYQLLTTGASEQTNKMNIYDFAGNEWEWTLEKNPDTTAPCVRRGACFDNKGSIRPASSRGNETRTIKNGGIAFRATLY